MCWAHGFFFYQSSVMLSEVKWSCHRSALNLMGKVKNEAIKINIFSTEIRAYIDWWMPNKFYSNTRKKSPQLLKIYWILISFRNRDSRYNRRKFSISQTPHSKHRMKVQVILVFHFVSHLSSLEWRNKNFFRKLNDNLWD